MVLIGAVSALFVLATPQIANADEALVIDVDRGWCRVFDGNGDSVQVIGAFIKVLTDSATGHEMFQCHAQVENDSGAAVNYDALNNPRNTLVRCAFRDENGQVTVTESWHETVSADGGAVFTCDFNEDPTPAVAIAANSCNMFDGDGFLVAGEEGVIRVTPSDTNSIECTSNHLANSTGNAQVYSAYDNPRGRLVRCGLTVGGIFRTTEDWHETVTPNGKGRIFCRFNDLQQH